MKWHSNKEVPVHGVQLYVLNNSRCIDRIISSRFINYSEHISGWLYFSEVANVLKENVQPADSTETTKINSINQ